MTDLYSVSGSPECHSNLGAFGEPPEGALALKFADAIDDGRWITDAEELERLRREDAPLAYTRAGLIA
jgi:hypothetical protein